MAGQKETLVRAVHAVFAEWSALSLAVENEFGGRNSREKALGLLNRLVDGLISAAERGANVYVDEIEQIIEVTLIDEFNEVAEDDSPRQVAEVLCTLYREAREGSSATADMLLQRVGTKFNSSWVVVPPPPKAEGDSSDDEDADDDAMCGSSGMDVEGGGMLEQPKAAPVVDEDGFQMVPTRRGRGCNPHGDGGTTS